MLVLFIDMEPRVSKALQKTDIVTISYHHAESASLTALFLLHLVGGVDVAFTRRLRLEPPSIYLSRMHSSAAVASVRMRVEQLCRAPFSESPGLLVTRG